MYDWFLSALILVLIDRMGEKISSCPLRLRNWVFEISYSRQINRRKAIHTLRGHEAEKVNTSQTAQFRILCALFIRRKGKRDVGNLWEEKEFGERDMNC